MEKYLSNDKIFYASSVLASITYIFRYLYGYYAEEKKRQFDDFEKQIRYGSNEFLEKKKSERSFYFCIDGNAYLEYKNSEKKENDLIYKEEKQSFYKSSTKVIEGKKIQDISFNPFYFKDALKDKIVEILPNQDIITDGLVRQENVELNFLDAIIFVLTNILSQFKGEIMLDTKKYCIRNGDHISVFGETIYDQAHKMVTVIKPLFIMGGGMDFVKSYIMKDLKTLSSREMFFKYTSYGLLVLSGICLYSIAKNWFKRKTNLEDEDSDLEEIKEENDNSKCIICLEKHKNLIFYPCMHNSLCYKCYENLDNKHCPVCKNNIINLIRIQLYKEKKGHAKKLT